MKSYHILNLETDVRKVVVATSYINPISAFQSIALELASINYKGEVIFDLLLSNGFASNRFLSMHFDGVHLSFENISVRSEMDPKILDELYLFFYEHPVFVNASSLSEVHKHLLLDKTLLNKHT